MSAERRGEGSSRRSLSHNKQKSRIGNLTDDLLIALHQHTYEHPDATTHPEPRPVPNDGVSGEPARMAKESLMYVSKQTRTGRHDTFVTYIQLAGIGLITFGILLLLALVLPGAA